MSSDSESMDESVPTSSSSSTKKAARANFQPSRTNDGDGKRSKRRKVSVNKMEANKQLNKRGHSDEEETSESNRKRKKQTEEQSTSDSSDSEPEILKQQRRTKEKRSPASRKKRINKLSVDKAKSEALAGPANRIPNPPVSSQSSIGSQSAINQAELTSHAGIIKSLRLSQNGSGKSALLSGILIALGGKAAVTSRTTSLKALVQKGKTTCRVSVTLLNVNGLRRYGDEITIERWVSVNGSTGYRIKSTDGKECDEFNWRPMKKPELDRILLGLNIQIDNPVAILNQEVARSFLRSKDPRVKFNLFYDGTWLSKLENITGETKDELGEIKVLLSNQKQVIDSVKRELIDLQRKYQKMAELDSIREKLTDVHNEYLWSGVIEQETSAKDTRSTLTKVTMEIQALVKKLEGCKKEVSKANEDSILQEQAETRVELAEKQHQVNENRAELGELKKCHAQLRVKLITATSSVESKQAQLEKLKTYIEKVEAETAAKANDETNEDAAILNALQTRKKQFESVVASLKLDSDNFQQAGDEKRETLQNLDKAGLALRTQIDGKKRVISALSSKKGSKYAAFGPKMDQLVHKIQANRNKFRTPPKGPLGACFRVKDEQYAAILENVLFNVLDSFIVGDSRDLSFLKELIDSVYSERGASQRRSGTGTGANKTPGIHCMRYAEKMYDVSKNNSSLPDAPSILELIEVENNDFIIMNALIDIMDIEKQIVFRNNTSAAKWLKNEATVPKTLRSAYTLQWYKFFPAPRYAARVMKMRTRAAFLRSGRSKESEIASIRTEMKTLENEMMELEGRKTAVRNEELLLRSRHQEKSNEISSVRRKLGEVVNDIKRHNAKVKEKEKRCDLSSYYEELHDLQDDLRKLTAERDSATKNLEPLKPKLNELETQRKILDKDTQELATKMASFDERREKISARRMQMDNAIKKVQDVLTNKEADKTKLTRELDTKEAELQEKLNIATLSCPTRIETKRSPAEVKSEYEVVKVRIKETEARLGDKKELRASIIEKNGKFKALKNEYIPLMRMYKVVSHTHESQSVSFEKMKQHMGRTLMFFFTLMAKQRGYEGRLLVDFETKELYYFVCPDGDSSSKTLQTIDAQEKIANNKTASQLKQTKVVRKALIEYSLGLSGGERSFATICFIMALWQVMECPFYMLDEFDVFMDAFNRKTSQTALMTHAKRFSQNQFILFSPLDLGELPGPDDACVLRLCPPKRNAESCVGNLGSSENMESSRKEAAGQDQTNGSPNHSTENIDPMGGNTGVKGKTRTKKQRRQGGGGALIREI